MSGTSSQPQVFGPFQVQIPQVVVNGMTNSVSDTEITSLMTFADRPVVSVVMSPITAKSYANMLLDLVKKYEEATGLSIPSLEEIAARRSKGDTHE